MQTLPKKLKKEPLIDGVFEIRFTSVFPAGGILPGILYGELDGNKAIEQLPMAQIPQAMRDADPNLQFAPLSRLDWEQFYINVGDHSVSIGFKHPYPGWTSFKPAITKVMEALKGATFIKSVERYALKYIDLLPATSLREQVDFVNFDVTLAGHKLENEAFQLRLEIPRDGFLHAVQVVSSATAILQSESRQGLIVDVDTIAIQESISFDELLIEFSDKLDAIHQANKQIFFACLKPETVTALEPEYE
ncbi:MAG: TIGR04255 family protein [Gammaproteobacteria bacterium]|nr:TIGR04255 family protein [Gammaproteobacteria bacterium]MBU1978897.1 TIGR04255 family protein [Gammaproteobacteria bacterium]